ncbi:hypothetical protein F2Q70_00029232 [Brassica cretica]|uniref:Uncharacterized protein n=1 Tax=Brassica cretica TaxID=69181 RepID=A0A8S9HM04_BRACR|nr:hypothetical protein F2Q70_00029232 [Brassica cretica]KAF2558050.1 hypothetical protein F2Q68_00016835 [Brassica cretica]
MTMDRSGDSLRTLMLGLCLEGRAMYSKVSNTDSWSLKIVLIIRRFMWRRSRGSLWILRSRFGPGGPCQTMRSFIWGPEVFFLGPGTETGPEGDVGIRRFSSQIRRSWLEPRGLCGCDWTLRSHKSAGLFLRSEDRIGTLVHLDPEVAWEPRGCTEVLTSFYLRNPEGPYSVFLGKTTTGTCLDSHSAARKLATIEFLFCILLMQEVTDRLRGCWCGCYDPSARLTLLSTSGKAGFRLLPVFHSTFAMSIYHVFPVSCSSWRFNTGTFHIGTLGPQCALGCTGVLGSFDSILRLAHTHSCFMSHTRFHFLWACHCGRATFVRVGQDRRSLET